MGKPDKKLKKILLIMGITGAVYGTFRYLLPLVVPFLMAWWIAALLRPSAARIARRCRITIQIKDKKKVLAIPEGIIGVTEFLLIISIMITGIYFGGCILCSEAGMLLNQIPIWIEEIDIWLTGMCHQIEKCLCLNPDCLVLLMREMLQGLLDSIKHAAMPYLMANSVTVFRWGMGFVVESVILLVAIGFTLQEMDMWKRRCVGSIFCREYERIGCLLARVGNVYLKTQGLIMVLTMVICTAGFWILKNPYYILAGVSLGILDALPILGTGTVLVPWAILWFFQRKWGGGLILLILYLICYFLREILEAKLMGSRVGLSSLETLISMYAGLKLFGILGLFSGPVGLLLIKDLVENFTAPAQGEDSKNKSM